MHKLKDLYDALETLQRLKIPVPQELKDSLKEREYKYLEDEVIPLVKQELEPLVRDLHSNFKLAVCFVDNELTIDIERQNHSSTPKRPTRKKKGYLKVTFPDGRVSYSTRVWKPFVDVVKYAGSDKVRQMNIELLGENIVTDKRFTKHAYAVCQKPLGDGYFLTTCCHTGKKYDIMQEINQRYNLHLEIEFVKEFY